MNKDIMNQEKKKSSKWIPALKFVLPSSLGILLFMCPIKFNGNITIPIAILSEYIQNGLEGVLPSILLILMGISFGISLIVYPMFHFGNSEWIQKLKKCDIFCSLFQTTWFSLLVRGFSFALCILTYYEIGTDVIFSEATGGLVFYDLLPILFTIFLLAGFLLPLLLNFGLLEFAGELLVKIMRPLFKLPGRSAIDAIASWLGDGTIGVLLTSKQYEEGFYTEREACVIGTSFSLVSITFCLVVINQVGLAHMFLPFYLTVTLACLVAAILVPKIPPLSRKKDCFIDGSSANERQESIPEGHGSVKHAYTQAVEKVKDKKVFTVIIKDGASNVLSMWITVIPTVMAMGTVALVIAEYTPLFKILGIPFIPFIKLLGIPEAAAVSQTLFAGFADMLLPSVMIANVGSDMARFIVAAVSVSQLIYLSEVGSLLVASKIPVKLSEIFIIFIERTIITLPIITLIAHLLF